MPIDQLRAPAFWMLSILTACPLTAERPWTVDAILNIPSLGDPQIRPDGRYYAYVQRGNDATVLQVPFKQLYLILLVILDPSLISTPAATSGP